MPIFPTIPNVPGVPPLPRLPSFQNIPPTLLNSDVGSSFGQFSSPIWGLYKDGNSVITADSVQTLQYRQEWNIADYPMEKGAFESYNKVSTPFSAKIRFASGPAEKDRTALLDTIGQVAGTLDLYDLITPEHTYSNVNIEHYDFSRSSHNGVGMIMVDVWVVEIRQNATTTFSNTQSPAAADPVNGGAVQMYALPQSAQNQVNQMIQDASLH